METTDHQKEKSEWDYLSDVAKNYGLSVVKLLQLGADGQLEIAINVKEWLVEWRALVFERKVQCIDLDGKEVFEKIPRWEPDPHRHLEHISGVYALASEDIRRFLHTKVVKIDSVKSWQPSLYYPDFPLFGVGLDYSRPQRVSVHELVIRKEAQSSINLGASAPPRKESPVPSVPPKKNTAPLTKQGRKSFVKIIYSMIRIIEERWEPDTVFPDKKRLTAGSPSEIVQKWLMTTNFSKRQTPEENIDFATRLLAFRDEKMGIDDDPRFEYHLVIGLLSLIVWNLIWQHAEKEIDFKKRPKISELSRSLVRHLHKQKEQALSEVTIRRYLRGGLDMLDSSRRLFVLRDE